MTAVLGNGIYDMGEAARLLGVSRQRLAAWFHGWPGRPQGLFRSDYSALFDKPNISFLDLIDSAVCVTLREKHKVSQKTIRRLYDKLSADWNTPHPFAREEFLTDKSGRVFCLIASDDDEPKKLIDILSQQFAIPNVLLPYLKRVEYNSTTKFAQVLPLKGKVVLDPRRKYGKPIVSGTGMPTIILNECYQATKSFDVVADWYNVMPDDVMEAVKFETEFSGIAA